LTKLHQRLGDHLGFIRKSCEEFDRGAVQESLRIAVSLRVIFHQTANSASILAQLKEETTPVLTTFEPGFVKQPDGSFLISVPMWACSERGRFVPLGNTERKDFIPAPKWWEEVIMCANSKMRRRDVILGTANEDGGAHVDPMPKAKTRELQAGMGTMTRYRNGKEEIIEFTDHHLYFLRQFGYEVLNSPQLIGLCQIHP
jgi:hypothetical protein